VIGPGIAAAVAPLLALSVLVAPAPASRACIVEDATLTWGFKESFRSYISGTIANGEWEVTDGATYATPNFGFSGGTGTYGDVAFGGAIRFTGHGGILDTTVANPRITWGGDSGVLYLDVSGTTQEGDPVNEAGVPFADLTFNGGVGVTPDGDLRLKDVSATLTDEGATAFGTYESGEALDPMTVQITFEPACALPEPTGAPHTPSSQAAPSPPTAPTWPIWIAGAAGAALIAGVTAFVVRRRRGATPPA
jgi:hypothetical protein